LTIDRVAVSDDGKTVSIDLPEIRNTWIMEIRYSMTAKDGVTFDGAVQNTIYSLEGTPVATTHAAASAHGD
jgi:hypothetical protein